MQVKINHYMIRYLLTICSFLILVSSCKKDDDDADPSARNVENLSGNYVFVSASAKILGVEQDITNNTTFIPACTKDDVINLKSDLTFSSTDAGVKCNPDGSYSGTWSLPNDNTIIIDGETFTITEFDGRNLKLNYKEDTPIFGQVDVLVNFRKQ